MFKNFSPQALGINGRQSELIELALTYAFRGMDVDMQDMLRRSQRTSVEDATKYLRATDIKVGGFELDIDLDADDDAFKSQIGTLHPLAELAGELNAELAYIRVPTGTDRLPYPEYFDVQRSRLSQIADVLAAKDIKLAIGFHAGKEPSEVKAASESDEASEGKEATESSEASESSEATESKEVKEVKEVTESNEESKGKEFAFIRDVEGFIALVNAVSGDNAGYLIDTWDWVVGGGTIEQLQTISPAKIVAVRMGSIPEGVEPTAATNTDRILPTKEGGLDHVAVVQFLGEAFTGPIGPSASSSQYKGKTRESIVLNGQEAIDGILTDGGQQVAQRPMDMIEDIPYEPTPAM